LVQNIKNLSNKTSHRAEQGISYFRALYTRDERFLAAACAYFPHAQLFIDLLQDLHTDFFAGFFFAAVFFFLTTVFVFFFLTAIFILHPFQNIN